MFGSFKPFDNLLTLTRISTPPLSSGSTAILCCVEPINFLVKSSSTYILVRLCQPPIVMWSLFQRLGG